MNGQVAASCRSQQVKDTEKEKRGGRRLHGKEEEEEFRTPRQEKRRMKERRFGQLKRASHSLHVRGGLKLEKRDKLTRG